MHGMKFPRTYHLPYSPGVSSDDKVHKKPFPTDRFSQYIMLEKMDGENTTFGKDYIHARSTLGYPPHWSRSFMKAKWDSVRWNIPPQLSIHGENLAGVHSIEYENLSDSFLVFGIRDVERNVFLNWDETLLIVDGFDGALLSVPTIGTLLSEEVNDEKVLMDKFREYQDIVGREVEGFVIRPYDEFRFSEYADVVGKWVRANHVQTDEHWMRSSPRYNGFPR